MPGRYKMNAPSVQSEINSELGVVGQWSPELLPDIQPVIDVAGAAGIQKTEVVGPDGNEAIVTPGGALQVEDVSGPSVLVPNTTEQITFDTTSTSADYVQLQATVTFRGHLWPAPFIILTYTTWTNLNGGSVVQEEIGWTVRANWGSGAGPVVFAWSQVPPVGEDPTWSYVASPFVVPHGGGNTNPARVLWPGVAALNGPMLVDADMTVWVVVRNNGSLTSVTDAVTWACPALAQS